MTIKITLSALLATLLAAVTPARAEEKKADPQPQTAPTDAGQEAGATKEEVRTLAEELRRLKLEIGLRDVEYKSYAGMGPAASKVYFAPKGLSIGGYGEVNYQNGIGGVSNDQTDLLRLVLYAGYRFNDRIVFNSEVEFEHAGKEISVEFAYLDFLLTDAVRLRVGNMIVPIGFVNEMHEPPFFNGVFRPDVEQLIIPSTWSENGIGLHGEISGFRYKVYGLNGLDVLRTGLEEPVETSSWLRNARSGSAETRAATFAGIVNAEYAVGPVTVGASFYGGRADQRRVEDVKATVTLTEAHAQFAWKGATARVLGVVGTLGDAAKVNDFLNTTAEPGAEPVNLGSRVQGGYGEVAYDVLSLVAPGGESSLSPFVRVEVYDLNAKVPSGATRDPAVDITAVTAGLTYKPIPTVVVKADYQRRDPREGAAAEQANFGIGFVF